MIDCMVRSGNYYTHLRFDRKSDAGELIVLREFVKNLGGKVTWTEVYDPEKHGPLTKASS